MKTTIEKLSPTRVKLSIAVTPEDLQPSIKHAYEHIAEQVNIPGFRKGKVPPPIIDQRIGRAEVLQHAVSEGLERFYRQAVTEEKVRAVGRPQADIAQLPDVKDWSGDLVIDVEVDVRPEFALPKYEGLELEVDEAKVSAEDVEQELETLRTRFGTLVAVDRPAERGDFVTLDLTATIDGVEVDSASNLSYEVGSGELLEGMDDAVESLSAGESTTFESALLGGDREGETALISVTVGAVKVRELPELDDDFAQLASPFDTVEELKADLEEQAARSKAFQQGAQARDLIVPAILEQVQIEVPQGIIDDEVHRHLESEGRLEDDEHRAEVLESTEKAFRSQFVLDEIVEQEEIKVSQDELSLHLIRAAQQYGMSPNDFVKALDESGQVPAMVAEVARNKALAAVLGKAKVVDAKGKAVDVSDFIAAFVGTPGGGDVAAPDAHDHAHDHEGHDHAH
ncbi:MAG: trigger factor [Micrococcales bacterium 73-13]|nr:MAG: trigger factor [Micrococcales bacterium 73-13]